MGQTSAAYRDCPTVTRKPWPFVGSRTNPAAACRRPEASDFKYNTVRIGKYMMMRTVNLNTLALSRDIQKALTAAKVCPVFGHFIF